MRFLTYFIIPLAVLAAEVTPPNIILIYADDIGWGDLGCYGAKVIPTPHVDRLAAEGTRYVSGYCTSASCTPSRYGMLTGEYPWRRKGTGILPGDAALIIPRSRPTVATALKGAGYTTGVIGKWHLGLGELEVNWNRPIKPSPREVGFDYSFIMAATGDRVPCVFVENGSVVGLDPKDPIEVSYKRPFPGDPDLKSGEVRAALAMDWSHGHNMALVNKVGRIGWMRGGASAIWDDTTMGDAFATKACEFIARNKSKPFFLYYASHENHVPRIIHPRFAGKTPLGPRGDAVVSFDDQVGRILAELERQGLTGNTLVILTSDNGPVLDDGYKDRAVELNREAGHTPAGPFRGGKYSVYQGGTRVPFLVRWPGHAPVGKVSEALISQVDFAASFTRIAGGDPAPFVALDSIDVSAALLGSVISTRDHVVSQAMGLVLSIREGDWSFVPGHGRKITKVRNQAEGDGSEDVSGDQLYNLAKDPGQETNVITANPAIAARLKDRLETIKAKGIEQPLPR
ncbi:MAG TPA: arylsulfatase [Opitutae bacterium]|nr:arylsulfatase [Opitutae bacterium]